MRFVKTWAVAAGAAAVLGGLGIGVAQASSPAPTSTVAPGSTSQTSHESEARGRVAEGETARHEAEARGRVAEGETHARHTGVNDRTGATSSPTSIPSASPTVDDNGSAGHGADD